MPWSGGSFSRVHDWTTDAGGAIDIEADRMDAEDDNFRDGINDCLHKGGQNTATSNLPMGGNRHTAVGNAAARDDYASAADVMDQDLIYYVDSGAADAYVITPSPAITAYEEGQRFIFRATNANTGASTLNINALGATAIQTNDGNALGANAIIVGGYYEVTYDSNGSRFVFTSPSSLQLHQSSDVDHDTTTNFVADEHIDHTAVTITAGTGLSYSSGGTDISASATIDLDIDELTAIEGNALDPANDAFVVDANGTPKKMTFQGSGFVVQTEAGATKTIAGADLNQIIEYTAAGGCVVTLNTGVGAKGNWMVFIQAGGSTAVTTVGTATVNGANGVDTTGTQHSGITLFCTAANTWVVLGDAA
jgi:hypothetical protein